MFNVRDWLHCATEDNMLAEMYARGPIAATVAVTPAFENYTGGIFVDTTGKKTLDHSIELVGWGVEDGKKYWIGRNSVSDSNSAACIYHGFFFDITSGGMFCGQSCLLITFLFFLCCSWFSLFIL